VISHEAGDEGFEYAEWLKEYACEHDVDLRLVSIQVSDPWSETGNNGAKYSLWDVYPYADFITYPSLYEGFGNAFLEAIYFKKPLLINRYSTFVRDIEPLGFDLVVMDGFLSKQTVQHVVHILGSPKRRKKMVKNNYAIATRHYSYQVLRHQLSSILQSFFGDDIQQLTAQRRPAKSKGYLYINSHQVMYKHIDSQRCSLNAR
jgi:glycosyltransferase involved in cell wall biosynthesis